MRSGNGGSAGGLLPLALWRSWSSYKATNRAYWSLSPSAKKVDQGSGSRRRAHAGGSFSEARAWRLDIFGQRNQDARRGFCRKGKIEKAKACADGDSRVHEETGCGRKSPATSETIHIMLMGAREGPRFLMEPVAAVFAATVCETDPGSPWRRRKARLTTKRSGFLTLPVKELMNCCRSKPERMIDLSLPSGSLPLGD
jgi:hypothetical protein